jgi:Flp pilus assembly protein TadD
MTLPLVLLLLDGYPLKRFPAEKPSALLREKIPFFALMIGAAYLTSVSLGHAKAFYGSADYPLVERLAQPGYRVSFYVLKTFVPLHLSPLYLYRPGIGTLHAAGWLAMASVTVFVLLKRRQAPAAAAAWLAFGAMIAPVSGLFQAGIHFAADRYTYLPCLPFAALFAGLLLVPAPRVGVAIRVGGAAALLLLFAALTGVQIRIWQNSISLWDHALWMDPDSYLPYNNRGAARADLGDDEEALQDYQTSIAIRDNWPKPWNNRGMLMATRGNHPAAVEDFTRSLQIDPDQVSPYGYRALSRIKTGDLAGAKADLDVYLRLKPDPAYFLKRATLKGIAGDLDGTIADCSEALRLQPLLADAWANRGMARLQKGDTAGARTDLETALRVAPPDWPQRARFESLLRSGR